MLVMHWFAVIYHARRQIEYSCSSLIYIDRCNVIDAVLMETICGLHKSISNQSIHIQHIVS